MSIRSVLTRRILSCAAGLVAGACMFLAPPTHGQTDSRVPVWSFPKGSPVLTLAAPTRSAAWFSISREAYDYGVTVRQREGIALDRDGDGLEPVELDRKLSASSVWAAVDLESGTYSVAQPDGEPVDLLSVVGTPRTAESRIEFLDHDYLYVFLVRPRVGAWWARVQDGGPMDGDSESNRRIEVELSGFEPLAPTFGIAAPPALTAPGDVVVALDPHSLNVFASRVSE